MHNQVERRLELLKMEGIGVSQPEIVKELSQKYQVSPRAIHYDFEHRAQWQPCLLQLKDKNRIAQKIINRYEQIYQRAAFKHVTSQNENVQVGALKVMLEATGKLAEAMLLPEIERDLDEIKQKLEIKNDKFG